MFLRFTFFAATVASVGFLPAPSPAAQSEPPGKCSFVIEGANVWNGNAFEQRDLAISNGRFVDTAPEGAPRISANWWHVIPPFADTHTHEIDQPRGPDPHAHQRFLDAGIYYALNPNNIRFDDALSLSASHVEAEYAGGGLTGPGGHPKPLYEGLVRWQRLPGIKMEDLPGRAYHEVASAAEARAAVEAVERQGARFVKLYLTHHEQPDTTGLTADNFRAAARHARKRGLYPVVHVNSAADFRLAAEEKVHAMVHMPGAWPRGDDWSVLLIDEADARLAATNGVMVVPTIAVGFNAMAGEDLRKAQGVWAHNLSRLKQAGVTLAAGADRWGADSLDEMTVLRSTGLFDGTELLNIATRNGIELIFPDRKIGRLEPGYEASFIVTIGDPQENWYVWNNVLGGMRGGVTIAGKVFPEACAP